MDALLTRTSRDNPLVGRRDRATARAEVEQEAYAQVRKAEAEGRREMGRLRYVQAKALHFAAWKQETVARKVAALGEHTTGAASANESIEGRIQMTLPQQTDAVQTRESARAAVPKEVKEVQRIERELREHAASKPAPESGAWAHPLSDAAVDWMSREQDLWTDLEKAQRRQRRQAKRAAARGRGKKKKKPPTSTAGVVNAEDESTSIRVCVERSVHLGGGLGGGNVEAEQNRRRHCDYERCAQLLCAGVFIGMATPTAPSRDQGGWAIRRIVLPLNGLKCNDNAFGDVLTRVLADCSLLQELDLRGNKLPGPLFLDSDSLHCANTLMRLNLSSCGIKGKLWKGLALLHSLTSLDMSCNHLTQHVAFWEGEEKDADGRPMPPLPALEELLLQRNNLSGPLPLAQICRLTRLTRLDLSHNLLSGAVAEPKDSSGGCSELRFLRVNSNRLAGDVGRALSAIQSHLSCSKLRVLDLSDNDLGGSMEHKAFVHAIDSGRLRDLRVLRLSRNVIHGFIPGAAVARGCPALRELDLHHNELEGQVPEALCSLGKLEILHLQHNKLAGEVPTALLQEMHSLRHLSLYHNKGLTGGEYAGGIAGGDEGEVEEGRSSEAKEGGECAEEEKEGEGDEEGGRSAAASSAGIKTKRALYWWSRGGVAGQGFVSASNNDQTRRVLARERAAWASRALHQIVIDTPQRRVLHSKAHTFALNIRHTPTRAPAAHDQDAPDGVSVGRKLHGTRVDRWKIRPIDRSGRQKPSLKTLGISNTSIESTSAAVSM
jgi:Leucine-rich repeat (LRR) protein